MMTASVIETEYELHGDRILVRPDKPDQKTSGGIIVAETIAESKQFGTVLAVSRELFAQYASDPNLSANWLPSVGDRVLWGDMMGIDLKRVSDHDVVVLRYPAEVLVTVRRKERAMTPEELAEAATPKEDVLAKTRAEMGFNR